MLAVKLAASWANLSPRYSVFVLDGAIDDNYNVPDSHTEVGISILLDCVIKSQAKLEYESSKWKNTKGLEGIEDVI